MFLSLLRNICLQPEKYNSTSIQLFKKSYCLSKALENAKEYEVLKYNAQECEQIINIINNNTVENLLSTYKISSTNAKALHLWKQTGSDLQHVRDLGNVKGLSARSLQTLCDRLLKTVNKKQRIHPQFVTPSLNSTQRQLIRSCVAVRIGIFSISWVRIEVPQNQSSDPCWVTDWEHHNIEDVKLGLRDLVEHSVYFNSAIPEADCYILESPEASKVNANLMSPVQKTINLQRAQFTAMISYALTVRRNIFEITEAEASEEETMKMPNVFYMRHNLSARLFNTLVGNERVSVEQTILDIMSPHQSIQTYQSLKVSSEETPSDASNNCVRVCCRVEFPMKLREMFSESDRIRREFLGQTLLLNLTFLNLILFKDAKSIEKVICRK